MDLLNNITPLDIQNSLKKSLALQINGKTLWEETPRAGKPRTQFIEYLGRLHPLKAVTLDAIYTSGVKIDDHRIAGYTSHMGRDWLRKIEAEIPCKVIELPNHTATEVDDFEQSKKTYEVLSRPNQAIFRNSLLGLFKHECLVTGCKIIGALEAAHIQPKSEGGSDINTNGILLRADIHRLFDRNLCAICPKTGEIYFCSDTREYYSEYHKKRLRLPETISLPSFNERWSLFKPDRI